MCYKTEILRLGPQNDIATETLGLGMTFLSACFFVIPAEAGIQSFYYERTKYIPLFRIHKEILQRNYS